MQHAVAKVVVNLHFGILGEFKGVCVERAISQSGENHRQAIADYIIQIHQIAFSIFVRQTDKTSTFGYGKGYERVVECFLTIGLHLHSQVNVFVGFVGQLFYGRKPDGTYKTA